MCKTASTATLHAIHMIASRAREAASRAARAVYIQSRSFDGIDGTACKQVCLAEWRLLGLDEHMVQALLATIATSLPGDIAVVPSPISDDAWSRLLSLVSALRHELSLPTMWECEYAAHGGEELVPGNEKMCTSTCAKKLGAAQARSDSTCACVIELDAPWLSL